VTLEFTGEAGNKEIDLGVVTSLNGLGACSITAWANPDAIGLDDPTVIIAKDDSTGNDAPFKVQMQTTDTIRGILDTGAGGVTLDGVTAFAAGVWAFVAMTYDGVNKRLYFDGALDATGAQTGTIVATANNTNIASVDVGGTPRREWDGLLDDIRLYDRALSLAELQTMFASKGADKIVFGLLNRWTMREAAPGVAASGAASIKDLRGAFNGTPIASPDYQAGILR
jgi:hypothetical protein